MIGEIKSDWLKTQVEIQKSLHGYKRRRPRKKADWIDFVAKKDNDERRLLRAMIDSSGYESKLTVESLSKTLEECEERNFNEAILLAEEITNGAKMILEKNENLDFISKDNRFPYTVYQLRYAIQQKTLEQCKTRCGKPPITPTTARDIRSVRPSDTTRAR